MPGGEGYARLADGRSVFVPGALPGDLVEPRETVDKKSYLRVTRFELREPGAERIAPACPIAAACGGCDWMALAHSAQLRHKVLLVREALARVGGVTLGEAPEIVSAGEPLAYRSRVRLHIDGRGRAGFFGRGTHELVRAAGCLVVVPALDAAMAAVAGLPADGRALLARFEAVELRATPGVSDVDVELVQREGSEVERSTLDALGQLLGTHVNVSIAGKSGSHRRYELPGGAWLDVPPGAFTQVNWSVNVELVSRVLSGAKARAAASFLDLYSGVGNFSVPLARAGLRGVAVERNRAAVKALGTALAEQKLEVELVADEVETGLERLVRARRRFDLAVLDPPRAGAKDALTALLRLEPRGIAYVACDPVTLARDARVLLAQGFELVEVVCFDMFPQTHHVETLAWFSRKT